MKGVGEDRGDAGDWEWDVGVPGGRRVLLPPR